MRHFAWSTPGYTIRTWAVTAIVPSRFRLGDRSDMINIDSKRKGIGKKWSKRGRDDVLHLLFYIQLEAARVGCTRRRYREFLCCACTLDTLVRLECFEARSADLASTNALRTCLRVPACQCVTAAARKRLDGLVLHREVRFDESLLRLRYVCAVLTRL